MTEGVNGRGGVIHPGGERLVGHIEKLLQAKGRILAGGALEPGPERPKHLLGYFRPPFTIERRLIRTPHPCNRDALHQRGTRSDVDADEHRLPGSTGDERFFIDPGEESRTGSPQRYTSRAGKNNLIPSRALLGVDSFQGVFRLAVYIAQHGFHPDLPCQVGQEQDEADDTGDREEKRRGDGVLI